MSSVAGEEMKYERGRVGRQPRFRPSPMASALLAVFVAAPVLAQTAAPAQERVLPRVDVIGTPSNARLSQGSAHIVDAAELEQSRVFTVNEALRKVPGVHVREEEGLGLRPNIGIRGLNPTRSTKILLLEDGLPLSYAPYGDNASYYHPPIDRYDSIEVSKGSQVLRFGPQTAGGVINYITPEPQKELGGFVGLAAGNRGYLNAHLMATGNGAILDLYRKQADGARDNTHSAINDLNFKWAGDLNADNKLILRATYYDEKSTTTYSGLTEREFARQGARYNPFKNDFLEFQRGGVSATHLLNLGAGTTVTTSVYAAQFDRDWWRQASSTLDCNPNTRLLGDPITIDGCQVNGRLRNYTTVGIDSRVQQRYTAFGMNNQLEYGIKVHEETQRRKQLRYTSHSNFVSGNRSDLSDASHIQEDNKRSTSAFSGFLANRFDVTSQFAITPIVRIEHIRNERLSYRPGDNQRLATASFTEVVPGVGGRYQATPQTLVYGGVHKGFSPPRVEDALNNDGTSVNLNPERSVNLELGMRTSPTKDSYLDVAFFRNDFSNNVQVGSIAGGTIGGTGTNYAEGKALYQGIEFAGQLDNLAPDVQGNLFVRAAFTYLPVAEQRSALVTPSGGRIDNSGKRMPYAPEQQATITLGYRSPLNWSTRLDYVYVGKQFSDFANTAMVNVNGDGRFGPINAYGIWNATVNYTVGKTTLFATAKNLANETYIVDRTRGILVGMPRSLQAGLKYAF